MEEFSKFPKFDLVIFLVDASLASYYYSFYIKGDTMYLSIKRRLVMLLAILAIGLFTLASAKSPAEATLSEHPKVLVLVSDGMRQDLMEQYAGQGKMPAYKELMDEGVTGMNGMIPNVPPNTGPGWTSLITGAPPSVTGVTNNTFHDNTRPFSAFGVSAWAAGINNAQTLAKTADDQGLKVAALGWQAFDTTSVPHGVVVEYFPDWLTGRGIVANYNVTLNWTNILSPGPTLANNVVTLTDATGWTNVPQSYSPAKETVFSMNNFSAQPVLTYNVYIFDNSDDGVVNYKKALVSSSKNGDNQVAKLGEGKWSDSIPVTVNDFTGTPQAGGFYLKVIDLKEDLSKFRMFFSQVTRIRAVPQALEDDLAARFDAIMPSDFSPYILGLIDADTFVEQHTMATKLLGKKIYPYVIRQNNPDLALVGIEWTDQNQHRFTSRCFPGTEFYDAATAPQFCDYIKDAYKVVDSVLEKLVEEMGHDTNVFVTSDHGFSLTGKAINAGYVLQQAGLFNPASYPTSKAVAYIAGGTAQVYVNLQGRNPGGVVAPEDYETVRAQIIQAFNNLGTDKIEQVLLKEQTAAIPTALGQTYNMLHPDRTGDVVVFSKPPYQFDAPTAGQFTSNAPIYGQHGFVPNGELDRYATFAAAGPKIKDTHVKPVVTVLDLAPTVAAVLGINPPAQSQGVVLDILKN